MSESTPRLLLDCRFVLRKPGKAPKTHYVRSCSQDCDAGLFSKGKEAVHVEGKDSNATMGDEAPCFVCEKPTARMCLVLAPEPAPKPKARKRKK